MHERINIQYIILDALINNEKFIKIKIYERRNEIDQLYMYNI